MSFEESCFNMCDETCVNKNENWIYQSFDFYKIIAFCSVAILFSVIESIIVCLPPPMPMVKFMWGPELNLNKYNKAHEVYMEWNP